MNDALSAFQAVIESTLFRNLFWGVAITVITLAVSKVAVRAISNFLRHDSNPLPTSSIIVNIVRSLILIVGGSIILDSCFGIDTSSLITALGVGGIAVSLGFQDTLSNLIGGLQVTLMGIVKPGDNIEVSSKSGVVQDVSWRHTTIRDSQGQTIIIPNSIISTTALVHRLPANRVTVPFSVPHYRVADAPDTSDATASAHATAAPKQELVDIDQLSDAIVASARAAAETISPLTDGPNVLFSEISEPTIKGKVIFTVQDAAKASAAHDAVVRAIAREVS